MAMGGKYRTMVEQQTHILESVAREGTPVEY
jgi:hypothetical protein